jgi:hypothetical protein
MTLPTLTMCPSHHSIEDIQKKSQEAANALSVLFEIKTGLRISNEYVSLTRNKSILIYINIINLKSLFV